MTIPIAEEAKLYLTPWGHGNDLRFANLFREAWNRVPSTNRFFLTRYWEHRGYSHGLVCGESHSSPRIELVSGWRDRDNIDMKWNQAIAGEIFACGYLMRFCAPLIDVMPPDIVQDVVGHQLAHCWQYADSVVQNTFRWWDLANLETEAAQVMRSWGFNPGSLAQWFAQGERAVAG